MPTSEYLKLKDSQIKNKLGDKFLDRIDLSNRWDGVAHVPILYFVS